MSNHENNKITLPPDFSKIKSLNGDYRMEDGSRIVITDEICTIMPKGCREYTCKREEAILQLLAWMQVNLSVSSRAEAPITSQYQIIPR